MESFFLVNKILLQSYLLYSGKYNISLNHTTFGDIRLVDALDLRGDRC